MTDQAAGRPTWAQMKALLESWETQGEVEPAGWYLQMYRNGTVQFAITLKPVLVPQTKTAAKEAE